MKFSEAFVSKSVIQWYGGSENLDPYQNIQDPEHRSQRSCRIIVDPYSDSYGPAFISNFKQSYNFLTFLRMLSLAEAA
jgi:hypothetical protein